MAEFTNFDIKMFEKARELAETSTFEHFHIGCVITYKHHIIGQGVNSNKTHPVQKRYNRYRNYNWKQGTTPLVHSMHAEIAALNSIPYTVAQSVNWKDVQVYVYRISPGRVTGRGLAAPCRACRKALTDLGVRHFYYSGNDSYIYEKVS
jgi:deoxycytidylate deaminase